MIRSPIRSMLAALALTACAMPASQAQQAADCANATTQIDMTTCAGEAYEAADTALNDAYRAAMDEARSMDESFVPEGQPARVDLLRTAQRDWIAYRDAACEAEASLAYGGSMANQLHYLCLERLTQQRRDDLRQFTQSN